MKEKIIEVLGEFNEDIVDNLEQDLLASEILDSFEIVKLVVELEDAFDIEIAVEDVTAVNFRDAESIIKLIESYL